MPRSREAGAAGPQAEPRLGGVPLLGPTAAGSGLDGGAATGPEIAMRPVVLLACLLLAAVSLVLAAVGLAAFLATPYASDASGAWHGATGEAAAGYGRPAVLGLIAFHYLGAVLVIAALTATLGVVKHPGLPKPAKGAWLAACAAGCAAAAVASAGLARGALGCGVVFCAGGGDQEVLDPSGFRNGKGLLLLAQATILGLVFLALLVRLAFQRASSGNQAARDVARLPDHRPVAAMLRVRRAAASAALALVVLPGCFLLTALLPGTFTNFASRQLPAYMAQKVTSAEHPDAWLVTVNWRWSDSLVLKLFPDTMIFYGFLEILALTALAASWSPALRRWFSRRAPGGLSHGEACGIALLAAALALWLTYWLSSHAFQGNVREKTTEVLARTCGLTGTLFMALGLLPASKNTIWLEALGVSWEAGLWLHRWLGGASLLLVLLHALFFWLRFAQLGVFPHDALTFGPPWYPLNGFKGKAPHSDDFTIPLMEWVAYPSLLAMGLLPLLRRKSWELFKYFHYIFMALIPATLIHATNSWYYLVGGVAFWLVDAAVRSVRGASPRQLRGVRAHAAEGGITELWFDLTFAEPGMYCFVNVPAISPWQWHPFSLSGSPLDDGARMHIKAMGPATFTSELHALARQVQERGERFVLNVEGPYGPPLDVQGYAAVLLFAGGIGITPMHSTLRYLSQLARRGGLPPGLRRVRMVWVARTLELLRIFAESLREVLSADCSAVEFSAVLYLDNPSASSCQLPEESGAAEDLAPATLVRGRPDVGRIYDDMAAAAGGSEHPLGTGGVLAKVCGPPSMNAAAAAAAKGRPWLTFESELFVL